MPSDEWALANHWLNVFTICHLFVSSFLCFCFIYAFRFNSIWSNSMFAKQTMKWQSVLFRILLFMKWLTKRENLLIKIHTGKCSWNANNVNYRHTNCWQISLLEKEHFVMTSTAYLLACTERVTIWIVSWPTWRQSGPSRARAMMWAWSWPVGWLVAVNKAFATMAFFGGQGYCQTDTALPWTRIVLKPRKGSQKKNKGSMSTKYWKGNIEKLAWHVSVLAVGQIAGSNIACPDSDMGTYASVSVCV